MAKFSSWLLSQDKTQTLDASRVRSWRVDSFVPSALDGQSDSEGRHWGIWAVYSARDSERLASYDSQRDALEVLRRLQSALNGGTLVTFEFPPFQQVRCYV